MGVSGTGKTTVGKLLAERLSIPFIDADDHHTEESKAKMQQGIPLNDEDRTPWLEHLNKIARAEVQRLGAVIACSALKEKYRAVLNEGVESYRWIYLQGSFSDIEKRLLHREDHFMTATLLPSQFSTLEIPNYAITIDCGLSPENILFEILGNIK